jgi:hypothetical protein
MVRLNAQQRALALTCHGTQNLLDSLKHECCHVIKRRTRGMCNSAPSCPFWRWQQGRQVCFIVFSAGKDFRDGAVVPLECFRFTVAL